MVGNAMKKLLLFAVLMTLLLVGAGVSAQIALATTHPLRPGHVLFPVQEFAEQTRAQIILNDTERAVYFLELAITRSDDLFILTGSEDAHLAADYLDQALDQLLNSINKLTGDEASVLQDGLQNLVLKIVMIIKDLEGNPGGQLVKLNLLQGKVLTLENLLSDLPGIDQLTTSAELDQVIQVAGNLEETNDGFEGTGVPAHTIMFPPGSPGAEHAFFILEGAHEELECMNCHLDGQYAGTPNSCLDCHSDLEPESHYVDDCAGCHTSISWQEVLFDHKLLDTSDCQSCHLADKPTGHYAVQCSACHESHDWNSVEFNHKAVGATDCQACHNGRKPSNHYSGQCSACHNTTNWSQATFNHQAVGATDCKACHSGRKPANHFNGQCSACHSTSKWSGAKFNHGAAGATDCKACHSGKKPANHFSGQCSACHTTSNWSGAKFNHGAVGATDCKACHSGRKPANHFDGQCSQCHTTSSWGGASFNHKFPMDHGDANGKCSKCHPSGGSQHNCFACHDKEKINKKHNEEGISDFNGRCLACHPRGKEGDDDD
jgi:hypothetical protein